MTDTPDDARLACGRDSDDLLEQVFAGRGDDLDAHQATCLTCRSALADADLLWAPLRRSGRRSEVPPRDLRGSVMHRVHDLARQTWSVEIPGAPGTTRVSAGVVAQVAEQACLGVDGVRGAWARLVPLSPEVSSEVSSGVEPAGAQVTVHLSLVAEHGVRIPLLARAARTAVRRDLAALTSVTDARVDIHVDDVTSPRPG